MTLQDIEAMPGERIGSKEIALLYGMSRADVLRKAYSNDPLQRWPFSFTFNGDRLMVPKTAFLAWARGDKFLNQTGAVGRMENLLQQLVEILRRQADRRNDNAGNI